MTLDELTPLDRYEMASWEVTDWERFRGFERL